MQVFFIKSTYNGNIYKVGDFYTGTEYRKDMMKMLDFNFKPTDGSISIMTRQITLPDDTSVRDYTHMIVPDVEKIYEIINIDQQNSDQYRINLVEDAFIGNYNLFNNEEMIVTRTNEYKDEWYQGANDITDMSYDYTSEVTPLSSQEFSGSKMWLAVWIQPPDSLYNYIRIETSGLAGDLSADSFDNLSSIISTYPEYTYNISWDNITIPIDLRNKLNEIEYLNKVVYNKAEEVYYTYVPILFNLNPGWYWKLGWHPLEGDPTFNISTFGNNFLNNSPDVRSLILLFPFSSALYNERAKLVSGRNFKEVIYVKDGVSSAASILSAKLIPESILSSSGLNVGINPSYNKGWLSVSPNSSIGAFTTYLGEGISAGVAYLKSTKSEIDLSLNTSMGSIYNREPFKHYELWVYGQKFDVPSYFVNNMRMVTNLTTDGITFNLYRDAEKTKLFASGTANFDTKWSIDQLALYAQNNPTYKDEFNNQQQQKWAQSFASAGTGILGGMAAGAAAGTMMGPGIGTAAGAAMGLVGGVVGAASGMVNTGVQTHYDKKQFELMQLNKQMQPDQIYGNSAASSLIQKIRNGIYWVIKTGNNQSQMINEYERKGYPTFITRKPTEMNWIINSLYGGQSTKIISGYFLKTIKNNYVTNEVNKKLTSGVTLIL